MTGRDLYATAHKAMRQDLFEVSSLAARIDATDPESRAEFRHRFDGLLGALRHHEEHEHTLVHPLLAGADAALLSGVEVEHRRLDDELDAVVALLDSASDDVAWHGFYLALNRYAAAYLLHIDHEERVLMPAIREHHDEVSIAAVARRDLEAPVEVLLTAAPAMLAVMNTADRAGILGDLAEALSEDEFGRVRDAVLASLDAATATRLRVRLTR